jgi:hypothetical protein
MDLRKYEFTTSGAPDKKKTNQKQKKRRKNIKKERKEIPDFLA